MNHNIHFYPKVAFVFGGFATNQWFWTQLRTYFASRGIELFRPDDDSCVHSPASLEIPLISFRNKAVANGAVHSRINVDLITSRFSHATHHARSQKEKQPNAAQTDAIAKIMDLTGLEQVKQQILRIKGIIETMNRQGAPINEERLNLVLLGNPGTGGSHPTDIPTINLAHFFRENHSCETLCAVPRIYQCASWESFS